MIICFQGCPGSGKSTVAKQRYPHAVVVSLDAIREELTGDAADQSRNAEVMPIATARAVAALEAGRDVVIDSTLARREWLATWEAMAHRYGASLIVVSVRVPLATALERNARRSRVVPAHIVERMYNDIQAFNYSGLAVEVINN